MNTSENNNTKVVPPVTQVTVVSKEKKKDEIGQEGEKLVKIDKSILMNGKSIARAIETSSKQNNVMSGL